MSKTKFTKLCVYICACFILSSKLQAQIVVTATSGTTIATTYTSLNAAISAVNSGTHKGAIVMKVHVSISESSNSSLSASGTGSASYTSIKIIPADTATAVKTISFGTGGTTFFTLNGANNVIIDGRPNETGNKKLLMFSHLGTTASSHTFNLTGGASNNTIKYCTFTSASSGTIACSVIRLTTGTNSNNTISNCTIDGGNLGVEINGTNGTPCNNNSIIGCLITNQKASSVRLAAAVGKTLIDSCDFTHSIATSTSGYQVFNVSQIEPSSTVTLTRNRAYNILTSAANFIHGIFVNPSVASGTLIARNNSFVLGSSDNPNTLSQVIRGVLFTGSLATTLVLEHNTIRVGGTHVVANGNPTSVVVLKSNTSTSSSFTLKNNLLINTRTGTNNNHTGIHLSSPTTGTVIVDNNTYYGTSNYYTSTPYTSMDDYKAAASANGHDQNSSFGLIDFVNNTSSEINLFGSNLSEEKLAGEPIGITTDILGLPRSSSAPRRGAFETPIGTILNNNTIGNDQTICVGSSPSTLNGSTPSGGYGVYGYQWLSTIDLSVPFSAISGANNANYAPSSISTKTYFKRVVNSGYTDTSSMVTITPMSIWTGAVNNNYDNSSNWCSSIIPNSTSDILVQTGASNLPIIVNGTQQIRDLSLQSSTSLRVVGSLQINGNTTNNGNIVVAPTGNFVSAAAVSNVTLQKSIIGQRGWRMFAYPFTTTQTFSSLASTNGIAISTTPSGASGLTDVRSFTNGTTNGWNNVTASSTTANTPFALFIRGLSSEVTGLNYTAGPSAFTFSVNGTLNASPFTVTPSASNFTLVGNPFAAPVNSSALTNGAGKSYYVYQISQGGNVNAQRTKAGAWSTVLSSSATTPIPTLGVIAYQAGSASSYTVSTSDINTTNAATTGLFSTEKAIEHLELRVLQNGMQLDNLFVRQDAAATAAGTDGKDLQKLANEGLNFYTLTTADNHRLAVDARNVVGATTIPLGVVGAVGNYQLQVANLNINQVEVWLKDAFTGTTTTLKANSNYEFDITTDAASKGENRFELVLNKVASKIAGIDVTNAGKMTAKLLNGNINRNNIAQLEIAGAAGKVEIRVTDMAGRLLHTQAGQNGRNTIQLGRKAGVQLITISDGTTTINQKMVKQ